MKAKVTQQQRQDLPRWLPLANWIVTAFNRIGLALGTQHIVSIPGRVSGQMHSTPVSLVETDRGTFVVTGSETAWGKNAREAGWGTLQRGRRTVPVLLREVPAPENEHVLDSFAAQVPHGVRFFERYLDLPVSVQGLAAAADRCVVFEVKPMRTGTRPPRH